MHGRNLLRPSDLCAAQLPSLQGPPVTLNGIGVGLVVAPQWWEVGHANHCRQHSNLTLETATTTLPLSQRATPS